LTAFKAATKTEMNIGQVTSKEEAEGNIAQLNEQLREYNLTADDVNNMQPPPEEEGKQKAGGSS